jgi:hypothetical protein
MSVNPTENNLTWATTGTTNSRAHIAVIEPYQVAALCGVSIARGGMYEIRPLASSWCEKCLRAARKLHCDPWDIGIENDLRGEVRS